MNTPRNFYFLLALAGLAAMSACSSTPSSSTASDNKMQMLRVLNTTVVGKPTWISQPDSAAIVEMNKGPLPSNYVLVGLDQNRQITAVLETTPYSSHNFQGIKVLSGSLGKDDEVALPGSEYDVAVGNEVENYLIQSNTASNSQNPAVTGSASAALANQFSSSQN